MQSRKLSKQESPPACTQEAYRPPRAALSPPGLGGRVTTLAREYLPWMRGLPALAKGGGTDLGQGGTYLGWGVPAKVGTPLVSWKVGTPWSAGR